MAIKITGTNTAAAPGITGDDTDTGLFYGTNEIGFSTGGTSRLTLDSSGDLKFPDSGKLVLGTGNDCKIHFNGTKTWVDTYNGDFGIAVANAGEHSADFKANSGVDLYYDNSKKFETTSGGSRFYGDLVGYDSDKIKLGSSADLQIYHDGNNSTIKDTSAGHLQLLGESVKLLNSDGSEAFLSATRDGAVEIYHNNVRKLNTEVAGIRVDGASGGDGILALYSNAGNSNSNLWRIESAASGSNFYIKNGASGSWETNIRCVGNDQVQLYYDNSLKLETTASGVSVSGDIAMTTNDINFGDTGKIQLGGSQDLQIYHDGSHSRIVDSGTGNLMLQSDRLVIADAGNSENQLVCQSDGAVELYHNGTKKLETTASGIDVSGDIELDNGGSAGINFKRSGTLKADIEIGSGSDQIAMRARGSSGFISFHTNTSSDERLRITSDGKVGIGTDSPDQTLHVHKGSAGSIASSASAVVTIENNNTAVLQFLTPNNVGAQIRFGDPDDSGKGWIEYGHSSDALIFGTNGPEKLRIDSSGRVGIGESSPSTLLNLKGTADGGATGIKIVADADTYSQLTLDGNRSSAGNACGIIAGRWNANDVCSIYLISGSDTTNKDDGQLGFYTTPSGGSSSRRLLLNENGVWYGSLYDTNTNAGLSANVFVFSNDSMGRASSSGKYKKNIETIQDSYADKILTMRPAWYQQDETTVNIPEDQGDNWGYWGFIAEEVAAIDPRLVTWKVANYATDPSDKTKTIRTPLSEPEPDNVAYDRFVPHLVNLLKRQATKIEALETKVTALEAS